MDTNVKLGFKTNMMIISVVAFLTTLIGVSFAWLRSDLLNGSTSLFVGSAELSLTFHDISTFTAYDLAPGEKTEKTFEVENLGETTQTFSLMWKGVTNTLTDKNYFMYTIENVGTGEQLFFPKYLPSNSTYIAYDLTMSAGETQTYKITVYYVDDPKYDQTQNSDHYFMGDIRVTALVSDETESLNVFVDGVHSDSLPTLSDYTVDTTRTYCTDGSTVAIVDGSVSISNKTPTTTCDLYLVSSSAPAITNDPYNLLIIDLDGATLESSPEITYRYSGDIIDLGIPTKSGYAFLGWQASGAGTTITENTKVTMGTTYSYVKAAWVKGYWIKTTETCTQGAPSSYTRVYKTCNQNLDNYTKVEKTCGVSSWTKTTSVCGVTEVTKKSFKCSRSVSSVTGSCTCIGSNNVHWSASCSKSKTTCTAACGSSAHSALGSCTINYSYSYPSSPNSTSTVTPDNCTAVTPTCGSKANYNAGNTKITCTAKTYAWTSSTTSTDTTCTVSGSCSSSTNGNSYVTGCTAKAYNFGTATTTTSATCSQNLISCSSSTNGNTYRSCTPNYSYALSTSTTSVASDICSLSSFTCSSSTVNQQYTTSCTPTAYDYGYLPTTTNQSYCFEDTSHNACSSSTSGETYISSCELIGPATLALETDTGTSGLSTGDVVRATKTGIPAQDFYVVSSNASETVLLAKYNLLVGDVYDVSGSTLTLNKTMNADNTSGYGLQSATAKAYVSGASQYVGMVPFSGTNYWDDSVCQYSGKTYSCTGTEGLKSEYATSRNLAGATGTYGSPYPVIYNSSMSNVAPTQNYDNGYGMAQNNNYTIAYYVNQYVNTLGIEGVGRLLLYEEGQPLVSSYSSILKSSTYWLGSARAMASVWYLDTAGSANSSNFGYNRGQGVRPVIVVSTSDISV